MSVPWTLDCPFLSATPTWAGTYDLPQILSVIPPERCFAGRVRRFLSLSACPDFAGIGTSSGCACPVGRGFDLDGEHRTEHCRGAQILGQTELRIIRRHRSFKWRRLRGDSCQPAEWRTGIESGGSHVRALLTGAGGEFHRGNGGRCQSQLFFLQDRPSQAGTGGFDGQHRKLRRRRELRADASVGRVASGSRRWRFPILSARAGACSFIETMSAATAAYEKQILDYRIWRSRCVDSRASEEINSAQVVTIRLDQERTKGRAL